MSKRKPVAHLKVLTFNIFIRPPGVNEHGNDYKDERLKEFCQLLPEYDVICLQELFGAFSSRRAKFLRKAKQAGFAYSVFSRPVGWFSGFLTDGALCIVSRFPIVAQDQIVFTKGVMSDQLAAKGALHALIEVPDGATSQTDMVAEARRNSDTVKRTPAIDDDGSTPNAVEMETLVTASEEDVESDVLADSSSAVADDNDIVATSSTDSHRSSSTSTTTQNNNNNNNFDINSNNNDNNNNNNSSNNNNNKINSSSSASTSDAGNSSVDTASRQRKASKRRGTSVPPGGKGGDRRLLVHVFTTHLQSSYQPALGYETDHFIETQGVRMRQLRELRAFIERCTANDWHDAMLMGDFNINARPPTHGDEESERRDAGDPLVPVRDLEHPFLVSQPYADMVETLSSPHWRIYDPLRAAAEAAGLTSHPITIGDVHWTGTHVMAREQHLTDPNEWRSRQCLDYIFLLHRRKAKGGTHVTVRRDLTNGAHTFVERFLVAHDHGHVVGQLSDHYGIVTQLAICRRRRASSTLSASRRESSATASNTSATDQLITTSISKKPNKTNKKS